MAPPAPGVVVAGGQATTLPSVAIGVPTYNRRSSVLRLCEPIAAAEEPANLLIVDDGSTDGTGPALARLMGPRVRVVSHAANAGFATAVVTLVNECAADYLLLVADDDVVDLEGLPRLRTWLGQVRPDLARTVHAQLDVAGMGPEHPTAPLRPEEFRDAASHGPGLVLRTDAARPAAEFLAAQVAVGNVAATTYPQAVIAAWVLACGSGWWWNDVLVREAEKLPSALRDAAGRPYWAPAARLDQALAFVALLRDLQAAVPAGSPHDIVGRLRTRHLRTLYPALRAAVAEQDEAAAQWPMDKAALRQMTARWVRRVRSR